VNTPISHIEPKIGEGIYLVKDVAKILGLDYQKTYRWIVGYWGSGLDENVQYTFGEVGNRAINFLSLIEFYTFFKLREKGLSSTQIKDLHHELSGIHNTNYPFAMTNDFYVEDRKTTKRIKTFIYYRHLESLMKLHPKRQFSLNFVEAFLNKIEFNESNLAVRFFPLTSSRNVVVDPKHQFGQPIVTGTNIKTRTLFGLYSGGETLEDISSLYNISLDKVRDAIDFQRAA